MNLGDIKKNYEKFDDEKLIKLATSEINSLRPEVVPILMSEIKKRKLSLDNRNSYSNEQFENPFAKEKIYYSNEYLEYFKSTKNLQAENIKSKSFFINIFMKIITSLILIFILIILITNRFDWIIQLILSLIIIVAIIRIIQEKQNLGKVADIEKDRVFLYKYPIMNFNIFRLLIMIQIGLNGLKKIEINYKDITKIFQKNNSLNKGYYIQMYNRSTNQNVEKRIYVEGLNKKDLNELIEIIKYKCIESKNKNVA